MRLLRLRRRKTVEQKQLEKIDGLASKEDYTNLRAEIRSARIQQFLMSLPPRMRRRMMRVWARDAKGK